MAFFDKVPHKKLIRKLRKLKIRGETLKWVKNWLKNRKQRVVVINGVESEYVDVTSGVPQGSVLGTLLFLIFINDFDDNLKSKISKFADDTKMGGSANSIEKCNDLQSDLDIACLWSDENDMPFNIEKCRVIHIGKKKLITTIK